MSNTIGTLKRLTTILTISATFLLIVASPIAYGYGRTSQWQITVSENCNKPAASFCGPTGGFWGWCEFGGGTTDFAGNEGDCQITGYGDPVVPNHEHIEVTGWDATGGTFIITSGTVTVRGQGPFPGDSLPFDTGFPPIPGHYSAQDLFGFKPPPGAHFNVQITLIPNR